MENWVCRCSVFCKGFYAYIGTMFGPGALDARIRRHMRKTKAKHWHIDYILEQTQRVAVYVLTGKDFDSKLSREAVKCYSYVAGFGCGDKRGDRSHLIYLKSKTEVGKFARFLV